jgi:hypothetical protein
MATALTNQVAAYGESVQRVIADSKLAVACWDSHKPIQEAILMAPGMVCAITAVVSDESLNKAGDCQERIDYCREMLASMTSLLHAAKTLQEHNFPLCGLPEFRSAMTELRVALCDLIDGHAGESRPPELHTGCASADEFAKFAAEFPPKESWYEEDPNGLRGPIPNEE